MYISGYLGCVQIPMSHFWAPGFDVLCIQYNFFGKVLNELCSAQTKDKRSRDFWGRFLLGMKAFPNPMVLTRFMLPCLTLGLGLSLQPVGGREVIQTALIIFDISSNFLVATRFWFTPIHGQVLVDSEETQVMDVDDLDKMV